MELVAENGDFIEYSCDEAFIRAHRRGRILVFEPNQDGLPELVMTESFCQKKLDQILAFYDGTLWNPCGNSDHVYFNAASHDMLKHLKSVTIRLISEDTALMTEGGPLTMGYWVYDNAKLLQIHRNRFFPLGDNSRWTIKPVSDGWLLERHSTITIKDLWERLAAPALHTYKRKNSLG